MVQDFYGAELSYVAKLICDARHLYGAELVKGAVLFHGSRLIHIRYVPYNDWIITHSHSQVASCTLGDILMQS